MRIDRLDTVFNGLARSYVKREAKVASLFPYDFLSIESFERRAQWLDENYSATRGQVADILGKFQKHLAQSSGLCMENNAAVKSAQRIADPNSLVVVTGQQAGLFTGPLYTIYKAITCISLARTLEARLRRPVIPVFWVASEDHGFDEVAHAQFINGENVAKVSVSKPWEGRRAVGHMGLPDDLPACIESFVSLMPNTEKKQEWISAIKKMANSVSTLNELFAAIMHRLLGSYGLVLLDPLEPGLKEMSVSKDLFVRILAASSVLSECLTSASLQIRGLGFTPQVEKPPQDAHMFYFHNGQRVAIERSEDGFRLRSGLQFFSSHEMERIVRSEPQSFSTNVATRPLWQDSILPTLAYVAGPGEIAYFASLSGLYTAIGQEMPPIVPRLSATLIEAPIEKLMHRYDVRFSQASDDLETRLISEIAAQDELGIDTLFDVLNEDIKRAYEPVIEKISKWDSPTGKLAEENLGRVVSQVDFLRNKVNQRHRQRCQDTRIHFKKLQNHLWPGSPQERVLNVFPYLLKHDNIMFEYLLDVPLEWLDSHCLVYL